jgi:hypothetical protein
MATKKAASRAPVIIVIYNRPDSAGNAHYYVDKRIKKASVRAHDVIRWFNATDHDFVLKFHDEPEVWPFKGKKRSIRVPAFKLSRACKVVHKVRIGYSGDIPFENPPADPVVDAGD